MGCIVCVTAVEWQAYPAESRLRGHGFWLTPSATAHLRAEVDAEWRVLGPHGDRHTRRLSKPKQFTLARCDAAVLRLYSNGIWGCGHHNPEFKRWKKRVAAGEWVQCGVDVAALENSTFTTVEEQTLMGLDPFSPVFQHAMVNGVANLAMLWHLFLEDPDTRMLCAEWTCDAAFAAWRATNTQRRRLL